jgi:sorbitol-specific phosphotransferase system component IIC
MGIVLTYFSDPEFTTPGYMGIKVSEDQKKFKLFLKLRPSEFAHFEGIASGITNTSLGL